MWTPPPLWSSLPSRAESEAGDHEDGSRTRECSFTRVLILLVLACCIVLPPVLVFGVYGTEAVAKAFVQAVPDHPTFLNALAFFAVNSVIIITALPLWVLGSMVVGFTFGFWAGLLINYLTVVFASFTCFTIGRYVFLDSIRAYLFKQRQTRVATRIIELNDFKFLVLFRFMPFPLAAKNYLPACIKVSPVMFLFSVMISAAIFTPLYTFIGASAKKLATLYAEQETATDAEHGGVLKVSGVQIVIVSIALIAMIATMVLSYFEYRKVAEFAEDESLATPRTEPAESPRAEDA
jgi:uncharacterized membrane protein YdjX (TVP38/TMEM64 family)